MGHQRSERIVSRTVDLTRAWDKVGCVSTNHSVDVLKKLVEEILENVLSDDGTKK